VNKKNDWQKALTDLITDPKELLQLLELDDGLLEAANAAARLFPLKVPRRFVANMEKGNPHDPLLRQVLPLGMELDQHSDFHSDPLQEREANPVPGLLHKYHGRVLLTLTSACAVHCRYCFRREFPYHENNPGTNGWGLLFDYIRQDASITEVILSGGDPLVMPDKLLKLFTDQLEQIPHVKRLRFHTRIPVVLPERITDEFVAWISSVSLNPVIVIHMNHPREMSETVKAAMLKLRKAGVTVLNQSVLLRGVNDDVVILTQLSEVLYEAGVLPYYLHVLDKVQGTAHFDMKQESALALHEALMHALPGYLVPRLVREEAGKKSKTLLFL
jgi:EF-P beta-lysylation protein EpmB